MKSPNKQTLRKNKGIGATIFGPMSDKTINDDAHIDRALFLVFIGLEPTTNLG